MRLTSIKKLFVANGFGGGDTSVARGLRLGLTAIILMVLAACAGIVISLQRLESEVADWSQMEAVDTQRERLQRTVQQFVESGETENTAIMVDALAHLYLEIERTANIDDGLFAAQAGATLSLARRQFNTAIQTQRNLLSTQNEVLTSINRLSGRTAQVRQTLSFKTEAIEASLSQLEARQRRTATRQIALAGWLSATAPLAATLNRPDARNNIGQFVSRLPPPCAKANAANKIGECSVLGKRLHDALDRLLQAPPARLPEALSATRIALMRFENVMRAEYTTLASEHARLLDDQQQMRNMMGSIAYNKSVLENISRSLVQVKAAVNAIEGNSTETGSARNAVPFLFARMRFGGNALDGASIPAVSGFATKLLRQTTQLEDRWGGLNDILAEHQQSFSAFDRSMANLGAQISGHTETIRRDTLRWVSLFATISFVSAGVALLTTLGAAHFARRQFIQPLTKVTATILSLARGNISRSVNISQRAFGFDRLGAALEELRRAMTERQELALRSAEQTEMIQQNLAALEKTTNQMQWLAMHDPLTELHNRRAADQEMLRLTRNWNEGWDKGRPPDFCLIHLDIDHFKDINDTLGHDAGDFVLSRVAAELKQAIGLNGRAFRIGGDEFLVVVTQNVNRDYVEELVQGLLATLTEPAEYQGHVCQTGASFGIAFGSDAEGNAQSALANADIALYESKRAGRGTYRFFTDKLRQGMRRRTALANRLRNAVEEGQFVPFYQPQFHAHDLSLRGVETLCRWKDPEEGWLPPAQFLDIAEELHLMGQIDQHLFHAAARDLEYLREQGFPLPRISFNVTAQRLSQTDLAQDLTRAITGDTQIVVELLESMSLDNLSDTVRWSIDALKEAGIAVEIDDFGSCRASIAGLISVGPDAMKIDKAIIQPMAESDQHMQLVKSIIQIGQTLSIEVVAEGVETAEHVKILSDLGCDILQGFALARPMSLETLEDFLRKGGHGRLLLSA